MCLKPALVLLPLLAFNTVILTALFYWASVRMGASGITKAMNSAFSSILLSNALLLICLLLSALIILSKKFTLATAILVNGGLLAAFFLGTNSATNFSTEMYSQEGPTNYDSLGQNSEGLEGWEGQLCSLLPRLASLTAFHDLLTLLLFNAYYMVGHQRQGQGRSPYGRSHSLGLPSYLYATPTWTLQTKNPPTAALQGQGQGQPSQTECTTEGQIQGPGPEWIGPFRDGPIPVILRQSAPNSTSTTLAYWDGQTRALYTTEESPNA